MNDWISKFEVSESELGELKRPYFGSRGRASTLYEIALAAKKNGDFEAATIGVTKNDLTARWHQASYSESFDDGLWYRLKQDIGLPVKYKRPDDPKAPFEYLIDGRVYLCCPVYCGNNNKYRLFRPYMNSTNDFMISTAGSFIEFVGFSNEANGLPNGFTDFEKYGTDVSRQISAELNAIRGGEAPYIKFVVFDIGVENG